MTARLRDDWRAVVGVVSGGHFLSHFYKLTLPPLFPLLRDDFGLNNTELGLLVSVLVVGGLLQAPVGNVVDRVGAKWVFVLGVAVTGSGVALVGLGPTYPAILLLAVVAGIGQSAFHPADYALINAVVEPDVQGRAYGFHTFSGYAGYAAAPVVVGTIGFATGWRVALFVVGGIGLLYAAISVVALVPAYKTWIDDEPDATAPEDDDRSSLAVLKRRGIVPMVGYFLVTAFAIKGIQSFTTVLSVDAFGFAEAFGNTLLTVFFTCGSIGILAGGVLADRYAPGTVIAATLLAGSSVLIATVLGLVPTSHLPLLALFGTMGFFISLTTPSRDRLVEEQSRSGSMGWSFGVVFTGGTVGSLAGPVVLGALADAVSITSTFLAVGACYLLAGGLALSVGRRWPLTPSRVRPSRGD